LDPPSMTKTHQSFDFAQLSHLFLKSILLSTLPVSKQGLK